MKFFKILDVPIHKVTFIPVQFGFLTELIQKNPVHCGMSR